MVLLQPEVACELALELLRRLEDTGKTLGILAKSVMVGALGSVGLCSCIYRAVGWIILSLFRSAVVYSGSISLKVLICLYCLLSAP